MGNIVQNDQSNLEKFQCCMEKEEKIPYPTQCDSSVSEYIIAFFKMVDPVSN